MENIQDLKDKIIERYTNRLNVCVDEARRVELLKSLKEELEIIKEIENIDVLLSLNN